MTIPNHYTEREAFLKLMDEKPGICLFLVRRLENPAWTILCHEAARQLGISDNRKESIRNQHSEETWLRIHAAAWGTMVYMRDKGVPPEWTDIQKLLPNPDFIKQHEEFFKKQHAKNEEFVKNENDKKAKTH
jgi:hypothetical protein